MKEYYPILFLEPMGIKLSDQFDLASVSEVLVARRLNFFAFDGLEPYLSRSDDQSLYLADAEGAEEDTELAGSGVVGADCLAVVNLDVLSPGA